MEFAAGMFRTTAAFSSTRFGDTFMSIVAVLATAAVVKKVGADIFRMVQDSGGMSSGDDDEDEEEEVGGLVGETTEKAMREKNERKEMTGSAASGTEASGAADDTDPSTSAITTSCLELAACLAECGGRSLFPCRPPFIDVGRSPCCLDPEFLLAFPEVTRCISASTSPRSQHAKRKFGGDSAAVVNHAVELFCAQQLQQQQCCSGCSVDLSQTPFPPHCVCGAVYCSPQCHKGRWPDHRDDCAAAATASRSNALVHTLQRKFWGAVLLETRVRWDPSAPATFTRRSEQSQAQKMMAWRPRKDYREEWGQQLAKGTTLSELEFYSEVERGECKERVAAIQDAARAELAALDEEEVQKMKADDDVAAAPSSSPSRDARRQRITDDAARALHAEFFGQFRYYVLPQEGDSEPRLLFRVSMVPTFLWYAEREFSEAHFTEFSTAKLPFVLADLSDALRAATKGRSPQRKKRLSVDGDEDEPFSPAMLARFVLHLHRDQDSEEPTSLDDMRLFFCE